MLTRTIIDCVDEIHKAKRHAELATSDAALRDRLISVNEAFRHLSEAIESYAQEVLDSFKRRIALEEPKNDALNEAFGQVAVQDTTSED